jgi:hypothetical protein
MRRIGQIPLARHLRIQDGIMKRMAISMILSVLVTASATAAAASEPAKGERDFGTLFPEDVSRALVVAVPPSAAARELERAVGDALHASGRVGRIVPSSVIGSFVGLQPAEIAARALRLPIDAVVVARAGDDGTTVLSATYRDGSQRGPATFSAAQLAPPPSATRLASAARPAAGEGAPPASAEPASPAHHEAAVQPANDASPAAETAAPPPVHILSPEEARAQFEEKYVGFKDSPTTAKTTQPYEGRYQRVLDWPELYAKVGRPDLAERSQSRRTWGRALLGSGIILSVAGILSIGIQTAVTSCGTPPCVPSFDGHVVGIVFQGVGLGAILAGSLMPRAVVPAWDARRLGESYNWQLRSQLGVKP